MKDLNFFLSADGSIDNFYGFILDQQPFGSIERVGQVSVIVLLFSLLMFAIGS